MSGLLEERPKRQFKRRQAGARPRWRWRTPTLNSCHQSCLAEADLHLRLHRGAVAGRVHQPGSRGRRPPRPSGSATNAGLIVLLISTLPHALLQVRRADAALQRSSNSPACRAVPAGAVRGAAGCAHASPVGVRPRLGRHRAGSGPLSLQRQPCRCRRGREVASASRIPPSGPDRRGRARRARASRRWCGWCSAGSVRLDGTDHLPGSMAGQGATVRLPAAAADHVRRVAAGQPVHRPAPVWPDSGGAASTLAASGDRLGGAGAAGPDPAEGAGRDARGGRRVPPATTCRPCAPGFRTARREAALGIAAASARAQATARTAPDADRRAMLGCATRTRRRSPGASPPRIAGRRCGRWPTWRIRGSRWRRLADGPGAADGAAARPSRATPRRLQPDRVGEDRHGRDLAAPFGQRWS